MPFRCPQCTAHADLEITKTIELAPDARWDEITLQVVDCRSCSFAALAVYTEARRGALDADDFEHDGCRAPADEVERIRQSIQTCPHPQDAACICPAHLSLAGSVEALLNGPTFKMILGQPR